MHLLEVVFIHFPFRILCQMKSLLRMLARMTLRENLILKRIRLDLFVFELFVFEEKVIAFLFLLALFTKFIYEKNNQNE